MAVTKVVVGGQEFVIDRVSAAQVSGVLRIVSRLSLGARKNLTGIENVGDTDFLWGVLGSITEEDLISLAALSIGCDKKFAEEHFDLNWVIVAVGALLRNANIGSAVANFTSALAQTEV
jgi:hypothetical protein